jgi:hypothetical protein
MHEIDSGLIVIEGGGTSLDYSFDEERNQLMVACPGCGRAFVAADQRGEGPNLGHEPDCPLQRVLERVTKALNAS